MQTYISRYIRSTKLVRKFIEWVTSTDQTQRTVKDRVVYYRFEDTGIQDKDNAALNDEGIIELTQYTT